MNRRCEYIQNTSAKEDLAFPPEPDDFPQHSIGLRWAVVVDQKTGIAYTGSAFHPTGFLRGHVETFVMSDPPTKREQRELDHWPYRRRV